jgi:type I restriction enzyme S subunit
MSALPIGELATVVSGATPSTSKPEYWNGDIPWVTPADLAENGDVYYRGKPKRITQAGLDSCAASLLPPGSILFSSRAPIGHIALTTYPLCTNQGFKSLVVSNKLDPLFAYFALKFVTPTIIQRGRGATFAEVNKEIMEEQLLPYCDLPQQRNVARRLLKAHDHSRTRGYALQLCDEFLPAAFLQMFGDPRTNFNNHRRAFIEELGKVETGNTPPRERKEYFGNHVEWIKSDNISLAEMHPSRAVEGLSAQGEQVGTVVGTGSLLVTCIAGSLASIGNVVLTDRRVAFNQQINSITPHDDVDPLFLYALMLVAKPMVQAGATEAMKKMITKSKLEELVLFKPPVENQRQFAKIVRRWSGMRQTNREALRQADHLFHTLLHNAFST